MRTIALLLLFTATAHAQDNEITVTESARALRTSSANALSDEGLVGGSIAYARRLPVAADPLELWAYASFDFGFLDGTMFQTLSTDVSTLGGTAGVRARYDLWRERVIASARVELGMIRAALEIEDEVGHALRDHGWGATSGVAAGLDLVAVRGSAFSLALRFELGASATSSIPFVATPADTSDNMLELEMTATSLGSLNLSGPWFAASLVGQF